jgi:hypothetical protein
MIEIFLAFIQAKITAAMRWLTGHLQHQATERGAEAAAEAHTGSLGIRADAAAEAGLVATAAGISQPIRRGKKQREVEAEL